MPTWTLLLYSGGFEMDATIPLHRRPISCWFTEPRRYNLEQSFGVVFYLSYLTTASCVKISLAAHVFCLPDRMQYLETFCEVSRRAV
eukprot:5597989-Amphidinium_carterae.1